jgi:hypothetical protein
MTEKLPSRRPVTANDLVADLERLGVQLGMTPPIHRWLSVLDQSHGTRPRLNEGQFSLEPEMGDERVAEMRMGAPGNCCSLGRHGPPAGWR